MTETDVSCSSGSTSGWGGAGGSKERINGKEGSRRCRRYNSSCSSSSNRLHAGRRGKSKQRAEPKPSVGSSPSTVYPRWAWTTLCLPACRRNGSTRVQAECIQNLVKRCQNVFISTISQSGDEGGRQKTIRETTLIFLSVT